GAGAEGWPWVVAEAGAAAWLVAVALSAVSVRCSGFCGVAGAAGSGVASARAVGSASARTSPGAGCSAVLAVCPRWSVCGAGSVGLLFCGDESAVPLLCGAGSAFSEVGVFSFWAAGVVLLWGALGVCGLCAAAGAWRR